MQLDDPELARALAIRAIQGQLLRLKWLAAATRFELAMRRHDRALRRACKANFNPDQPRVRRGQREGGQWTDGEGGGSPRTRTAQAGFGTLTAEIPVSGGRRCVYNFGLISVVIPGPTNFRCPPTLPIAATTHGYLLNDNRR
ncbi:MAG TPA: hypothetical protein VFB31_01415 [Pseudolabrys sp.]|nr:hypothetical protein [Pseudolabrys sp.]